MAGVPLQPGQLPPGVSTMHLVPHAPPPGAGGPPHPHPGVMGQMGPAQGENSGRDRRRMVVAGAEAVVVVKG